MSPNRPTSSRAAESASGSAVSLCAQRSGCGAFSSPCFAATHLIGGLCLDFLRRRLHRSILTTCTAGRDEDGGKDKADGQMLFHQYSIGVPKVSKSKSGINSIVWQKLVSCHSVTDAPFA